MNKKGRMVKNASLLSIALVLFAALGTVAQPTDRSIHGLTGKVKRFDERSETIIEKDGALKKEKGSIEETKIFDESGRLSREMFSGMVNSERRFLYEKNGVRKSITDSTQPFEKPRSIKIPSYSVSVFTYDAKENSILEKTYSGKYQAGPVLETSGPGDQEKFFFDDLNRLVKKVYLTSDGREMTTEEYFHRDSSPNPTDVVISLRGRAIQFIKCTYEVDSAGNWTKRTEVKRSTDPRHPVLTEVTYRKISYY